MSCFFCSGTVSVLCSFPVLFTRFVSLDGKPLELPSLVHCSIVIAIFQFGWAATQVSHLALIPQLTSVESERVELSALRLVVALGSLSFPIDPMITQW